MISSLHPADSAATAQPRPIRILFVSSTMGGGSGRSQRELCTALKAAGAETMMLVDNAAGYSVTRFLHEQLWDASVRFKNRPLLGGSTSWLRSLPGRTPLHAAGDVLLSPAPENAFPDLAISFCPDIVVGSSIERPTWRQIRATCDELNVPTMLYMREETALRHVHGGNGTHAAVLANSQTLVAGAKELGVEARFVPSIVNLEAARTTSSRERIVLVNPREEHGVMVVPDLARTFPTIEFVLQESWPLTATERATVDRILAVHQNVWFRSRKSSPAKVFSDAAIVLAPHRIDNRPRTILEALSNGIPVIASDLPGLVESVGPGGLIVDDSSGSMGWRDAVASLTQDPAKYRQLEAQARAFSARPEVQEENVVRSFLQCVGDTTTRHGETIRA